MKCLCPLIGKYLLVLLLSSVPLSAWASGAVQTIEELFVSDPSELDWAETKLTIDRLIDPSVDVPARLAEINTMVVTIKTMIPRGANSWNKIEAIRQYIYQPGPWNNHQTFAYDHADPIGKILSNKLLADYLDDRLGNCITMPFLFLSLADRLDLNVTASTAPLHVLVKFTDDTGTTYNLEPTSGAGPTRDIWYREQLPMTDVALRNRVYLDALSRTETLAVMSMVLVEHLIETGRYQEAIAVSDIILAHYPHYAYALVKRGTAYYHLIRTEFYERYSTAQDVPPELHARLSHLNHQNQSAFARAEALGWQPLAE